MIGSSFVALELAQTYRRLGAEVTILARVTLLTRDDPELRASLQTAFKAEGIRVLNETQAKHVSYQAGSFIVESSSGRIEADRPLVATGRRANTAGLGLENAGITTDCTGVIVVDDYLRTSAPNIYASGDCCTCRSWSMSPQPQLRARQRSPGAVLCLLKIAASVVLKEERGSFR